jgi:hypothetical protein
MKLSELGRHYGATVLGESPQESPIDTPEAAMLRGIRVADQPAMPNFTAEEHRTLVEDNSRLRAQLNDAYQTISRYQIEVDQLRSEITQLQSK